MPNVYTAIADIIDPEVLADQASAKFTDNLVIGNTGLVLVDPLFPIGSPGTEFKVPFWKRMTGFAAMSEGTALTTNKVTADAEFATVLRAGGAWAVYDTATLVSMADPHGEISSQIARRAAEYVDDKLVLTADKSPNLKDISATGAGTIDPDSITASMIESMGDQYAKFLSGGALIMHSKVYGDLLKLDAIQNQYQSGMDVLKTGLVPTIVGLPIIVSDRVTKSTVSSVTYYNSYIVGPGALALFHQRTLKVEFDRDILLQADVIASTMHFAPHLFGWDSKTDAQKAEDARSITVVKIKSK